MGKVVIGGNTIGGGSVITEPTVKEGSKYPVQSGAVYTALQEVKNNGVSFEKDNINFADLFK